MQQQMSEKANIDAQLVNSVTKATTEVLATMAYTEVSFKGVQANQDYKPSGDISAVIGISGEHGEGVLALSFPLRMASTMVGRLIGVEADHVSSEDRCDGVGELVNMISGHTKASLSDADGETYKLSLPTVIQGPQHEISSRPKNNPYLAIMFEAEAETFFLQVSFKRE